MECQLFLLTRDTGPVQASLSHRLLVMAHGYFASRFIADFHSNFLSLALVIHHHPRPLSTFLISFHLPIRTWLASVHRSIRSRYRYIFASLSLSPSRSLRLLVRLVYRPTLLSTTSTAFSPKPVFGCRVKRLAKVQVSFIAYTRSRASIHRSHPCRFFFPLHPFFLFIIQEITLENLLSNEIFFSRRQKTWTCLVSIFRLEISSLETSFESETGFFNPEALVNDG